MVAVATSIVLRGSLRSAFNGSGEILPRACRVATARRMTGRYEHFDARPGGSYGLLLAYADASVPREVLRRLRRRRPKGRPPVDARSRIVQRDCFGQEWSTSVG